TSTPATASPNALNFSSAAGGPAPAPQTVALMGDVGAWTASPNQTWIGVAPSSGSGTGNVSVSVNPAGLDRKSTRLNSSHDHYSYVPSIPTRRSSDLTSTPATASPNALNFSSAAGGPAPAPQTVALMGDVGAWTASPNQTWIGVAPSSGSGTGNVSVSVNPAG